MCLFSMWSYFTCGDVFLEFSSRCRILISVIKLLKQHRITCTRSTKKRVKPCFAVKTRGIIRQSISAVCALKLIWIRSLPLETTLLMVCTCWASLHILEQSWSTWTEFISDEIQWQNVLLRVQPALVMLEVLKGKPCFASTAKGMINLLEILNAVFR